MNKRGDFIIMETVMFIILNIIFIMMLVLFVSRSGEGSLVYEQAYAKQIGLMLDSAKPGTTLYLGFQKGVEIAEKNGKNLDEVVKIYDDESKVVVDLAGKQGYAFHYFTGYKVTARLEGELLKIEVDER